MDTLRTATSLGVGHLSAYHLTVEERTRLGVMVRKGEYTPISEEQSEAEYLAVHKVFTDAGYEHYEVSNYARPACRAKHNSSYWRGVEYLGLGPGAHSFSGDNRTWCSSTVAQYAAGDLRYDGETLTRTEHLNEYVMTSLRCVEGIDLEYIASHFGPQQRERIESAARRWLHEGTLQSLYGRLFIPAEKFLVSDAVIESLFV
jgi:oxygen-independent coproporphyrinogen-3 oxidase